MKCHKHYDSDAVGICLDCSKALCPECVSKYTPPLCDSCMNARVDSSRNLIIRNFIITLIGVAIGLILPEDILSKLIGALVFAGVPWGWSSLNKVTPNVFLFLPLVGWLIYFSMKLSLSAMIGVFIMPYKIYKMIEELKSIKKIRNLSLAN